MRHKHSDNDYRCIYEDAAGRICCAVEGIVDEHPHLCAVCGEVSRVTGRTADGRHIRSCGDAVPVPEYCKP